MSNTDTSPLRPLLGHASRRGLVGKEAACGMRHLRWLLVALAAIGCGLPKNVVRQPSSALVDTQHTTLGGLTAPATAKHPGESGFLLFNTGEGAIQARVAMADPLSAACCRYVVCPTPAFSCDCTYRVAGRGSLE